MLKSSKQRTCKSCRALWRWARRLVHLERSCPQIKSSEFRRNNLQTKWSGKRLKGREYGGIEGAEGVDIVRLMAGRMRPDLPQRLR